MLKAPHEKGVDKEWGGSEGGGEAPSIFWGLLLSGLIGLWASPSLWALDPSPPLVKEGVARLMLEFSSWPPGVADRPFDGGSMGS